MPWRALAKRAGAYRGDRREQEGSVNKVLGERVSSYPASCMQQVFQVIAVESLGPFRVGNNGSVLEGSFPWLAFLGGNRGVRTPEGVTFGIVVNCDL